MPILITEKDMRCIKIEQGDKTVLTVETNFLWMKKQTRYQADGRIAGDFYRWLKLPDKTIVPDAVSFQLDAWLRAGA